MLRAAMRLPWLIAKCCVHVRASVWLSVCVGDWQNPRRLRASCRKQSTGIILHSRPKHLNTQCSNSPKSDKAETHPWARAHTHTSAHTHANTRSHTHLGLTPTGRKPCRLSWHATLHISLQRQPSSPSPPAGEALMPALKGSTYIPNLQATWSSVIQLGEEREGERVGGGVSERERERGYKEKQERKERLARLWRGKTVQL